MNLTLILAFLIGESGISSLAYCSAQNLLIAGGKKGNIFVIDLRKGMNLVNSFSAHENSVKSVAIDNERSILYSGSTRSDIKVLTY